MRLLHPVRLGVLLAVLAGGTLGVLAVTKSTQATPVDNEYSMEVNIAPVSDAVGGATFVVQLAVEHGGVLDPKTCFDGLVNGIDDDGDTVIDNPEEIGLGEPFVVPPFGCYAVAQWSLDYDQTLVDLLPLGTLGVTSIVKVPAAPAQCNLKHDNGDRALAACANIAPVPNAAIAYSGPAWNLTFDCIADGFADFTLTSVSLGANTFVDTGANPQPIHMHNDSIECGTGGPTRTPTPTPVPSLTPTQTRTPANTATPCGEGGCPTVLPVPPDTALYLDSDGDYVGAGRKQLFDSTNATITASYSNSTFTMSVFVPTPIAFWTVTLAAPAGQELAVGTYEDAQRTPFRPPGTPGIDVFGDGRGCNTQLGRFVVREFSLLQDGSLARFAASFEQFCEGTGLPLYGEVRFNSTIPYAIVVLSPAALGFDNARIGDTEVQSVTLTSTGLAAVRFGTAAIVGDNASDFFIVSDSCSGATLNFDELCTLEIAFTPPDAVPRNAVVAIGDDTFRAARRIPLSGVGILPASPTATATAVPPAPANDNLVGALDFAPSLPYANTQTTLGATVEPGEVLPCGIGATVWYKATATSDGLFSADTFGSDFNTVLAVYDNLTSPPGGLRLLTCNDDAGGAQSRVASPVTAGTTYFFQVGGAFSATGSLTFHAAAVPSPSCPGGNNGFESGIVDTNVLPCWTVVDQAGGSGGWCAQSGSVPPQGACGGGVVSVPAPPELQQAAMTNQSGPGSHVLYQCGTLASGAISFELYLNNRAGAFFSPDTLAFGVQPNQQFRADLVAAASVSADPFSVASADILMSLYRTQPGDALVSGYTLVSGDASAFVGEQACLRFAEVDNQLFFHAGVDDVHIDLSDASTPTATRTPTATATNTAVPPTATNTAVPATATATSVPDCSSGRTVAAVARGLSRPYNAALDLNNDGKVSLLDLVLVIKAMHDERC